MNDSQLELALNRKLKRLLIIRVVYLVLILLLVLFMMFRGWTAAGIAVLAAALVIYLIVAGRIQEDINEDYREALCARSIGRILKDYRYSRKGTADTEALSLLPEGRPEDEKHVLCREMNSGKWHGLDVKVFDTAYAVKYSGRRVMLTGCAVTVKENGAEQGSRGFLLKDGKLSLTGSADADAPSARQLAEIGASAPAVSAAGSAGQTVFLVTDYIIGSAKINTARKVNPAAFHLDPFPELSKFLNVSELWFREKESTSGGSGNSHSEQRAGVTAEGDK